MKTVVFNDTIDDSPTEKKCQFDVDSGEEDSDEEEEDSNESSGDEFNNNDGEVECSSGSTGKVKSLVDLAGSDSESGFENDNNFDVWDRDWNVVNDRRRPPVCSEESSSSSSGSE